jgi:hypothetical protein
MSFLEFHYYQHPSTPLRLRSGQAAQGDVVMLSGVEAYFSLLKTTNYYLAVILLPLTLRFIQAIITPAVINIIKL